MRLIYTSFVFLVTFSHYSISATPAIQQVSTDPLVELVDSSCQRLTEMREEYGTMYWEKVGYEAAVDEVLSKQSGSFNERFQEKYQHRISDLSKTNPGLYAEFVARLTESCPIFAKLFLIYHRAQLASADYDQVKTQWLALIDHIKKEVLTAALADAQLPLTAAIGIRISEAKRKNTLRDFYYRFDLTNSDLLMAEIGVSHPSALAVYIRQRGHLPAIQSWLSNKSSDDLDLGEAIAIACQAALAIENFDEDNNLYTLSAAIVDGRLSDVARQYAEPVDQKVLRVALFPKVAKSLFFQCERIRWIGSHRRLNQFHQVLKHDPAQIALINRLGEVALFNCPLDNNEGYIGCVKKLAVENASAFSKISPDVSLEEVQLVLQMRITQYVRILTQGDPWIDFNQDVKLDFPLSWPWKN